jgi:hypothetical protein
MTEKAMASDQKHNGTSTFKRVQEVRKRQDDNLKTPLVIFEAWLAGK